MSQKILQKKFKKSDKVVFRKVAAEFVLVPIHKDAVDMEALFSLNETGARIWEFLDGETDGFQIAGRIAQEFGQASAVMEKDTAEFLNGLEELNFIVAKG